MFRHVFLVDHVVDHVNVCNELVSMRFVRFPRKINVPKERNRPRVQNAPQNWHKVKIHKLRGRPQAPILLQNIPIIVFESLRDDWPSVALQPFVHAKEHPQHVWHNDQLVDCKLFEHARKTTAGEPFLAYCEPKIRL